MECNESVFSGKKAVYSSGVTGTRDLDSVSHPTTDLLNDLGHLGYFIAPCLSFPFMRTVMLIVCFKIC